MTGETQRTLRLLAVVAHPDDESLGFGGTLARYAAAGVEVSLVTATRGERGRYFGIRQDDPQHPGPTQLGTIRERELRAAAAALGVHDLTFLDYRDQEVDGADPREAMERIVVQLRRTRPDVVLTFGPEGAYGHPDHIAIGQYTTAAVVAAAPHHRVKKLYYLAWSKATFKAYEEAFRKLVSHVDGGERQATPWPDWAITTVIDTRDVWDTVWRAVSCHESQISAYEGLKHLPPEHHRALWGSQSFYRVFSSVNGGRRQETDLFEGLTPNP